MDYKGLSDLNKDFAKKAKEFNQDFVNLFNKWAKIDVRLTMVCALNLPINLIINIIKNNSKELFFSTLFPEFPNVILRQLIPFNEIKEKWGKISDKEFIDEIIELHSKQFDTWFPSKEDREKFKQWYESTNKVKNE